MGGPYENFITPEQSIPKEAILVPWESCITLGKSFSYHYDDTYKTPQEIIHLLIDIVAKGGNLALNIAPQPDGRLPVKGIEVLHELGAFLKKYMVMVYMVQDHANPIEWVSMPLQKKENKLYVFYLYEEGEERKQIYSIPIKAAIKTITKVGSNKSLRYDQRDYDTIVQCDKTDEVRISYIEGFCIQMEKIVHALFFFFYLTDTPKFDKIVLLNRRRTDRSRRNDHVITIYIWVLWLRKNKGML